MWFIFLIIALIVLFILLLLTFIVVYHRQYWRFLNVPHESPQQFLDLLKAIRKYVGPTADEVEQEHYKQLYARFKGTGAPFCGFYHLLQPRVLVLDRELVKQILIKDFSNFNSRGVYYNCHNDPLSADLWSRSGSSWRETRLKLEPIFRKEQMRYIHACIDLDCEQFMQAVAASVASELQRGCYIDMKRLLRRYVLASIASCVFGLNTPALKQKYTLENFEAATELALHTQRHDVVLNFILTRYYRLARRLGFSVTNRKVAEYFTTLIEDVVAQRENSLKGHGLPQHDYLQLLIDIKTQELVTHETDDDFDSKQLNEHLANELVSHAIGFVKVGFEPTANALSYVLHELALNEWAQDKARAELLEAMARHNGECSYECIQELKFMGQVISETIRINPIAPFLIRRTLNDYHVPSQPRFVMRKDVYVIIPTQAMHNDPANFPEPQLFKPERFSSAENKSREQCLWLGFGDGPRSCIGMQFAQLQMRLVIARLLLQYKFSLNQTRITIKYQHGMYLQVEPLRNSNARNSAPSTETSEVDEGIESKTLIEGRNL